MDQGPDYLFLQNLFPTWTAKSEEGKDSIFIFTIRSTCATIKKEESIKTKIVNHKNPSILVAEDNTINKILLEKILYKLGYKSVDFVDNGALAVEAVQNKLYDLILMDIQMPEMDGLEASKIIKNNLKSKSFIIGLSANVFEEDKKKAKEAGMDDYLEKPIQIKTLAKILDDFTNA